MQRASPNEFRRVGVSSGIYLFNEPLKKHFEEEQRRQAQAQLEGLAAPAASAKQA